MTKEQEKQLKNIELFLLDMDGTIYLDDDVFDGSIDFINKIISKGKKHIFLTNNSSKSRGDYVEKLNRLSIPATLDNVFTSGNAIGLYINEHYKDKKVYLVGTQSLKKELQQYNINLVDENPDIVLMGFDRELNYKKLEIACKALDNGAIYLATNCDWVCPIANGRYIPDCGSMCEMIEHATNRKPLFIGKPSPHIIDVLSNELNIQKNKICMIGDRVYTDIAAGFNAGCLTICVLSGESTLKTIEDSDIKPDIIVDSVKDLIDLI